MTPRAKAWSAFGIAVVDPILFLFGLLDGWGERVVPSDKPRELAPAWYLTCIAIEIASFWLAWRALSYFRRERQTRPIEFVIGVSMLLSLLGIAGIVSLMFAPQ